MNRNAPEDDDFTWNTFTKFIKRNTRAKKNPPIIIIEQYQIPYSINKI